MNNTWPGNEAILYPALFPGTQKLEGAPDTHCSCMCKVSLVMVRIVFDCREDLAAHQPKES